MAETEEKVKKSRKIAKHEPNERIVFGEDKEGKPYSKAYSPRRVGSKSAERWFYKNNMTLQQAIDAGMTTADIAWDLEKGFIKIAEAA